jgi:hypothetical protein
MKGTPRHSSNGQEETQGQLGGRERAAEGVVSRHELGCQWQRKRCTGGTGQPSPEKEPCDGLLEEGLDGKELLVFMATQFTALAELLIGAEGGRTWIDRSWDHRRYGRGSTGNLLSGSLA